jgi:hypothetical protein
LIFAIFGSGRDQNNLVPEQPPIPWHSNRTWGTPIASSWMYQIVVPSIIPLHQ